MLKPKKFKEQGQAQKSSARFVWNNPLHGWEIEGLDFLAAAKYWIQPLPGNVSSTQGSYKPLHVDFLAKYWLGLVLHSTLTR